MKRLNIDTRIIKATGRGKDAVLIGTKVCISSPLPLPLPPCRNKG
jgi:hypothetical protein